MKHASVRRALIAAAVLSSTMPTSAASARDTPVTEAELRADIAVLASDGYGGRAPGTAGETLTAHYIATALHAAGFIGGADAAGGWYQPVPLIELTLGAVDARFVDRSGKAVAVSDIVLRAPSGDGRIDDSALMFVGYGVDADGRVLADVRGKIVVLDALDRPGDTRWRLQARREALIAAGARATILLAAPQVNFSDIQRGYANRRVQVASRISRAEIEGTISASGFEAIVGGTAARTALIEAAAAADYAGVTLPLRATLHVTTGRRAYPSYNVIGLLPGRNAARGTVLMLGHWDHLGNCERAGSDDRICNGAVDNASGIAVLLAAARRLGHGVPLDRDVMVLATTAEEKGLLGAYHFVAAPPVPLSQITVALNVDTVAIAPRGAPMAMVGRGTTPLEAEVDAVGRQLGRAIDSDLEANAFIQRQDGWALTQAGVPSIMAGGSFADMALLESFLGGNYHGPDDELTDATPLGGAADDADLHVALARHFATVRTHPGAR